MPDFWRSCGYRLLTTGTDGRLTLTDDFLRASLLRPELAPVPESCAAELALHDTLMAAPRGAVGDAELAALADPDIRENYAIWLRFRGRLTAAPSLEAAYAALFRDGVDVPPLMVQQLTRGAAAASAGRRRRSDARARRRDAVPAAEDRRARRWRRDGRRRADGRAAFDDRRLRQPRRAPAAEPGAAADRRSRCPRRGKRAPPTGSATSATISRSASIADARRWPRLCRVLERWIAHFLGVAVTIEPKREIDDERWVVARGPRRRGERAPQRSCTTASTSTRNEWAAFCVCSSSGSRIPPTCARTSPGVRSIWRWRWTPQSRLKLKPQNLLLNLPLARPQ